MLASANVDGTALSGLISRASARDAQRLRRSDVIHANAWISALPSSADGKDTIMEPRVYLTAVRRLLGLPVSSVPAPCPFCQQTMDVYGDHAVCCKKSGDLITRHNRVRDLIAEFARVGLLSPELEKMGLLVLLTALADGLVMFPPSGGPLTVALLLMLLLSVL